MRDTFQVLPYKKSDRKEVFRFLRAVHPATHSDRIIHQWYWKYDANPFNRHEEPYILLLRDGFKNDRDGRSNLFACVHLWKRTLG